MTNWPSIIVPSFPLEVEVYKPQVRTEFEGGYVQSRPRTTRAVRRWTLTWSSLPEADYQALAAFFVANQGGSFEWTDPVTGTGYTCRFSDDELVFSAIKPGRRQGECRIEEV